MLNPSEIDFVADPCFEGNNMYQKCIVSALIIFMCCCGEPTEQEFFNIF